MRPWARARELKAGMTTIAIAATPSRVTKIAQNLSNLMANLLFQPF
jgi:hypothetical protein